MRKNIIITSILAVLFISTTAFAQFNNHTTQTESHRRYYRDGRGCHNSDYYYDGCGYRRGHHNHYRY